MKPVSADQLQAAQDVMKEVRELKAERIECELCGEPILHFEKSYTARGQAPVHWFCKFGEEGP